jgi:hypothetical protein
MKISIFILTLNAFIVTLPFGMCAVNPKLIPTDFTKWERVPVKKFGFTVELPKDRRDHWISNDQFEKSTGHGLFSFSLHPIQIGPGIEDRHVISTYFIVMTADQYRMICEKKGYGSYGDIFASTLHVFHKTTKQYRIDDQGKGAMVFRHDFLGAQGQVVAVSIVRYDYAYAESLRESDHKQILRILESVSFVR